MKFFKHFKNSIPFEKREDVLKKIEQFEKDLKEYKSFNNLPRGYYVRQIEGTDIYKFRINNGDRVLYQYDNISSDIIIVEYCKHDDQVRRARSLNTSLNRSGIYEYIADDYIEEEIDKNIDDLILGNYNNEYLKAVSEYELDDSTIALGVESDHVEDKKYLTLEQFSCIKDFDNPTIILGCAGSGKTLIGIKRLTLNNLLEIKTAYITNSRRLRDSSKEIYYKTSEDENMYIEFKTLEEICLSILGIDENQLMTNIRFKEWIKNNKLEDKIPKSLTIEIIWNEINSIIKGKVVGNKRLISNVEYKKIDKSIIDKKYRDSTYALAIAYDKWIGSSKFYDKNDLYRETLASIKEPLFKAIVYDEIQELNSNAIKLLQKLNGSSDFVFLGDVNQRINHIYDNIPELVKGISDNTQIFLLDKNYRSGIGIVRWINKLKSVRKQYFGDGGKFSIPLEIAIREGQKPYYINNIENLAGLFSKVSRSTKSIIVVGDEVEKLSLSSKGYDTSRVFTVEESRGIEYNQVYCLNLLEYINKTSNFNSIYIAATRSKDELTFIELLNSNFEGIFKECYIVISEEILILNIKEENDISIWVTEAKRLEKAEKYIQAAAAYHKAGNYKREELCMQAYEKQSIFFNLQENNIYIDITADKLNTANLSRCIEEIMNKYNISLQSWMEVICYHQVDNLPKNNSLYLGYSKTSEEISKLILASFSEEIMKMDHILLKIVRINSIKKDISIYIGKEGINIKYASLDNIRRTEKIYNEANEQSCKKYGITVKSHLDEIIFKEKIKGKDADTILNEIFGDG